MEKHFTKVSNQTDSLRNRLVAVALEWEQIFGVAPSITSAISEYDAARIIGHTDDSYGKDCVGRTAVTRGYDFTYNGFRYQIKANRPSGKKGSFVTRVGTVRNYDWDYLIWILYDRYFVFQEVWKWNVEQYRSEFENCPRLSPNDMRKGIRLK